MRVSVAIPDDLAHRLSAGGETIERRVLEAFAAEDYRIGRLTHADLRRLLGFATHTALDEFLKARAVYEPSASTILSAREPIWLCSVSNQCCRPDRMVVEVEVTAAVPA